MSGDTTKEITGSLVEPWAERQKRLAPARAARRAALLVDIDATRARVGLPPLTVPEPAPIALRPERLTSYGRLTPQRARLALQKSAQRDAERDARDRRRAAKAAGLKRYQGTPCIHGHGTERLVSSNLCPTCKKLSKQRHRQKAAQPNYRLTERHTGAVLDEKRASEAGAS